MRVVHASFNRDRTSRSPQQLLRDWPTLTDVAAAAAAPSVDITIVVPHRESTLLHTRGIPAYFTSNVLKKLRELQPDVLHLHGLSFPFATRAVSATLSARVLIQDHGGRPPNYLRRLILRLGFQRIHGVAFTAAEQVVAYRNTLPRQVRVFEVLESSSNFTPGDQDKARSTTGLYGDPCVLWVGRLNALKDPLTAIEAVRIAAQSSPGLQLWCCYSEGTLLKQVSAALSEDPNLAARVHLLGEVPHARVEELMRAADIFLSCSRYEGAGFALIEALACGTTPVVTDIPPFRAISGRGQVGRLVSPGDARQFAAALLDVALQSRASLRDRTIKHFQESLSFASVGRQLRAAYSALLT